MTIKIETTVSRFNSTRKIKHSYTDPFSGTTTTENQSDAPFDVEDQVSLIGQDLSNWKSIIRAHGNATNSLSGQRSRTVGKPGSATGKVIARSSYVDDTGNRYVYDQEITVIDDQGQFVFVGPPSGYANTDEADDIAKARFVSKARSRISPLSGGVVIGELRETLQLIRRPAQAIRTRLSSYLADVKKRSRGLRKASKHKKNAVVSQTWLEYAFGWTPLLNDIDNGAEALARLATRIPPNERITSFGQVQDQVDQDGGFINQAYSTCTYRVQTKTTAKAFYYGAINTSVSNPVSFTGAFGLRPHDFLPTIWELIPYSFVVDYFTNIGDIISSASFAESYLAWSGCTLVGIKEAKAISFAPENPNTQDEMLSVSGSINPGSMSRFNESISRLSAPSLVPSLRFRVPGSPRVGFNIAALLAQAHAIRF